MKKVWKQKNSETTDKGNLPEMVRRKAKGLKPVNIAGDGGLASEE